MNLTELMIRSATETRTVALIDDACQICSRTGLIAHLEIEDWRLCVDCLTRYLPWKIASYAPVPETRALADLDEPTLLATIEHQAGLTPVERTIIRQAVADNGPTFYRGIMTYGEEDTARYVAEAYVHVQINDRREQVGRQKLRISETINLTAAEVARQRDILNTPVPLATFKERIARRLDLATQLVSAARDAWRAGEHDQADALINLAEATSPLAQVGMGYEHYRSMIASTRTKAED